MKRIYWVIIIVIGLLVGSLPSTKPLIPPIVENIPLFLQIFIFSYAIYFTAKGGFPKAYKEDIKKHGKEKTRKNLQQVWLMSIFLPGSGQYLLGKTIKGITLFLLIEGLAITSILYQSLTIPTITIALWIYNIIDTYNIGKKIKI